MFSAFAIATCLCPHCAHVFTNLFLYAKVQNTCGCSFGFQEVAPALVQVTLGIHAIDLVDPLLGTILTEMLVVNMAGLVSSLVLTTHGNYM